MLPLLGVIALVLLAVVPATAETSAVPAVRIHGTATWTPMMDLALDEVAMLWTGAPRQEKTPPVTMDGASVLRVSKDAAAIRLDGVTNPAELVARARALRDANPMWETRLVLYAIGEKRNARSRRLLTEEIAVVGVDGTVIRELAADPLKTLEVAQSIAQRPDVKSVEPVAQASDYLQARLKRKIAKLKRQDQPNERQEFFALKRLAPGEREIPVERYLQAREHMRFMPLHSTAGGDMRHPSTSALGMTSDTAASFLGSWTPLGPGNIGGRTRAIVVHPTISGFLYAAGVAGGVWKTTNGGASWTPLTDTLLPNLAVSSLDMDPTNPNILYAGTGEGVFNGDAVRGAGIFKTIDGGATWSQLATTANTNFNFVNKIRVLSNGTTVLAATRTGLFRSADGGLSWSQVINASGVSGCFDIAAAPLYVLASCGTFAQGTVHRSNSPDASTAFAPVLGPSGSNLVVPTMGRTSIAIAQSNPTIAYALASSLASGQFNLGLDGVYKSTDSGMTWTATVTNTNPTKLNRLLLTNPVFASLVECGFDVSNSFFNQGWYDNVIAVDPADPNRVWVGGIDLFRSDDGGFNWGLASFWWTGSSPGAFAHADQHTIVFDPGYNGTTNRIMFVGNDGGVFEVVNARAATTTNVCSPAGEGLVWIELNNNYGVTQFYHGLPYPGPDGADTFFGGAQDNGTIRGTAAGGIDGWVSINGGDGGYVAVESPSILYSENTGLSIQKSFDGGSSFDDATAGILGGGFLFIAPFTMSPNNSQVLFTGGDRMWRTTNGAGSWGQASQIFGCGSVSAIAVAPNNGAPGGIGDNLVLAGTSGGCIFRTAAGLTSTSGWTQSTATGIGFLSWIAFDQSDANTVYATSSTFTANHVYKSTDGGVTFTPIDGNGTTGLPDVPAHTIVVAPGSPSRLYVGTDLGVFSSDDGGASWAVENTGFANVITEALAVGQVGGVDHVLAFTHGRGVFRVALPASFVDIATTVATVPASTAVLPGTTVNVTNTVRNLGTPPTSTAFTVGFALVPVDGSGNATGSDIPLPTTRTAGPLAGFGTSSATTAVPIPADTAAGSYKVKVRADVNHDVVEDTFLTNNDKLTNSFTVAIPDLTVNSVTFTPAASGNGMNISVTHTLKNLAVAPGNAPASVSGIYLATNASFSSVVAPLGTVNAPALNANALGTALSGAIVKSVQIPGAGVVPPGRYFVLVRANDDSGFIEATTANNVGASATSLIVGPDLVVTTGTTPTGAAPGMNISATYTVKNQGGAAATFNVGFTLVPVTAGGTPTGAGNVAVGPSSTAITLNPGITSAALSSNVFLPPDLGAGFYKLRFTADPANAVAEADEGNNDFLSTTILNVVRPDLAVQSVTFTPAASRANGSVTVTHVVKNVSPAPGTAPASSSSLFLSSVNNSVVGAIALGNASVPQLLGLGTATVAKPVTIPLGTPPGLYFVLAFADAPDAIVESVPDASNLGSSVARLIVGPDLSITTGTATGGVAPGTNLSTTYTLKNGGGETATNFVVGFTLVRVTPVGADIPLTATRTVSSLSAGAMQAFTDGLPIPADTPPGIYKLRITVNSTGAVQEADPGNNTFLTANINVARADLMVTSVTFTPAASRANGSVTVTHVLKNLAPAPGTAAPTVSSLFLNSVNTSVTGGIFLGNVSAPQILGAGMATLARPVTIPLGTPPGLYFVLAQADAGDALIEQNEGAANIGTSVAKLIVGPDLTVTAATAAAGVATGMNLSVNYTLKNLGGEAAASFEVGFRLVPVTPAGVPTGGPEMTLGPNRVVASLGAGLSQPFTSSVLIPADTVAGNFKVRVIADVTTAVTEANETNNELLTGLVKVGRPDLTVPSVTFTPAAAASGGNVSVTHVVKNITALNGNAPPSQSAIYLSQNASFAGVLSQLATVSVPALASNAASAALVKSVNVGNLSTGLYFFVVRADDPGALIEQGEGNNVGVSATGLIVGPDASVSAATTAVTGAGPGTNVSVSYTLKNLGVVATGTFNVGFDVTPVTAAGVPNGMARPLGTVRPDVTLTAGQTRTFSDNALLPADLNAGTYRIGVTVFGFSTPDANVANDTLLTSGVLTVFRSDLVVNSVGFTPAAVVVGGNLSATHTVRNATAMIGNAPASFSSVFLSTNASVAGIFFTYPMNISVPALLPGMTSAPITTLLPLDPTLAPGKYFVGFMADAPGLIFEADEGNNVLFAATPVRVGPDPAVTAVSLAPTSAAPGANVSVTRTLTNVGATATGAFDVDYVLEPLDPASPIPDVTLLRVHELSLGPVGTAGATRSGTVALTIPPGTAAGQYKILVVADPDGTLPEADETNNVGITTTLNVVRADLVMSVFTPPTTLIAGRTASLTNTVQNKATAPGAAGPFGVGVFFSNTSAPDTTGDTLVGNRSLTGLAGGGTSAVPVTITVPSTTGRFFLKAFADFADVVVEANESNNVTVKPVTVVPDLAAGRTNVTAGITFNIGGSPPVCLASISGGGSALETITTQTGASFSGGKLTFFDSQGGSDTINFSGTVAPAGNVSGTFTLLRTGGGGGSGSGSFTGTSGLGTPGALVLNFTGTFTAGGSTCAATAQVIFGTGPLGSPSVVPASLTAGAGGNVDVNFSTGNSWPFNGALQIAFPSGFDLSNVNFAGVTGPSGSFVTSVSGQTVTLQRFGGSTYSPGPVSITLSGVRNPVDTGTTGTFSLTTTTGGGVPIDTGTAPGVTLTAGTLASPSVTPASLVAGAAGNVDVSFFTAESWPADGMLRIDFPAGFDVSGASFSVASGANGNFSVGSSGQTVTVTRSGGSSFAGSATITLGGIQNPATTGTTGTFSLATTTSSGGVIDTGTAPGVDITP